MSGSVYKNKCPDCGCSMRVRHSVGESPLLRTLYLQCTNVACGSTFKAYLEVTHRLSPSGHPESNIDIPMADNAIRAKALIPERTNEDQLGLEGF